MKVKWKLFLALGLMLFFLVGHTIGTLTRKNVTNEKTKQTILAMESTFVELPNGISHHTIDEFYQGMSLALDASILLVIGILMICIKDDDLTRSSKEQLLLFVIFWTISISALSFIYIFPVPAITCLLASLLLFGQWYQTHFQKNLN
ncbi:hypothetical protein EHR04_05210 [Leptospira levettii]|uniref:LIC_13387 family protein n=2 Tax=Leptospira levettii TaxID=2023178 RepID=UPI00109239EC|nr:hypothetical protein [Leptospira levettii]TGM75006.1 hypothetical protein EHR04_05210 [Leptospira levettii]